MRLTFVVAVLVCCVLLSGCGDGIKRFPLGKVNGKVVCEGVGVSNAMVYFEPLASEGAMETGEIGHAISKDDGTFSVGTYGLDDGAVVGKHRIRVGRTEASGDCNCSLNAEVGLMEFEVKSGSVNELTVTLPKKTKNEPKANPGDFGDEPPETPLKK